MSVALVDMDIYSAEYVKEKDYKPSADPTSDLIFSSFVVVRQVGNLTSPLSQTQTYLSFKVNPLIIITSIFFFFFPEWQSFTREMSSGSSSRKKSGRGHQPQRPRFLYKWHSVLVPLYFGHQSV